MSSNLSPEGPDMKKQALSIILIGIIVVGGYVAFTALTSIIFQSNKYDQVGNLGEADNFDVQQIPLDFPNFSLPDNWMDLFDPNSGNTDWLLNMLGGAALLSGLFGGFDNFSQLETPVFWVYPEGITTSISDDDLWRYTAYDNYLGSSWERTNDIPSEIFPFTDGSPITFDDEFTIRYPFGETSSTTFAIPTAFPYPYIREGSTYGNNINQFTFYIDTMNGSTVQINVDPATDGNFTYNFFRLNPPSESEIQFNSVEPQFAPQTIKDVYLQMPLNYRTSNPNYNFHMGILESYVTGNYTNPTTYQIADIIRNYLADNFVTDSEFPLERPGTNEDIVDWFLGRGSGLPMDFAAAFVMLSRGFDIPCRYASGYNTKYSINEFDSEAGRFGRQIKFLNMDAWNEIYFTTSPSGEGYFAPFIVSDSITLPPTPPSDNEINIKINGNYNNTFQGNRNDTFYLEFELVTYDGTPINGQQLTIYDETYEKTIGTVYTDIDGWTDYFLTLNNSFVAGTHLISVSLSTFTQNVTAGILNDQVNIVINNVNPTLIDRSISNFTQVAANIFDPVAGQNVRNALLSPVLIRAGIPNPWITSPIFARSDNFGNINQLFEINSFVPQGIYEFRLDFNGTFEFDNPFDPPNPIYIPTAMSSSSNIITPFEVYDPTQIVFDFYVNDTFRWGDHFYMDRTQNIKFSAYTQQGGLNVGGNVHVFDYTYDPTYSTPIASFTTNNITGLGSVEIALDSLANQFKVAGPHQLLAYWSETGANNNTFYLIVDEPVEIFLNIPSPSTINRSGVVNSQFSITGSLYDPILATNIRYGVVTLRLFDSLFADSSSLLDTGTNPFSSGGSGSYSQTFGVADATPAGDYYLRTDFNGTWYLPGNYQIDIGWLTDSSVYRQLTVNDPDNIYLQFWVNGVEALPSYIFPPPTEFQRGPTIPLTVRLFDNSIPRVGEWIEFFDDKQDRSLGGQWTDGSGLATIWIPLDNSFTLGLVRLRAEFNRNLVPGDIFSNYSQIFLNDSSYKMEIMVTSPSLVDTEANNEDVIVYGWLRDPSNNFAIPDAQIYLVVRDSTMTDITGELLLGSNMNITSDSGIFSFVFRFDSGFGHQGIYHVGIEFYGDFYDGFGICSAAFDSSVLDSASSNDDIKVYLDRNDYEVEFYIDGIPTQSSYWGSTAPEYQISDAINLTARFRHDFEYLSGQSITFFDEKRSITLGSGTTNPSGYLSIYPTLDSSFIAGLVRIRASHTLAESFTQIFLNDSMYIDVTSHPAVAEKFIRNVDLVAISGYVRDSSNDPVLGASMRLYIRDDVGTDVTDTFLSGSRDTVSSLTTGLWSYSFIYDISLQGIYDISVEFTGQVYDYDSDCPGDYTSLSLVDISSDYETRVYAGITLNNVVVVSTWVIFTDVDVSGELRYDNGSMIEIGIPLVVNVTFEYGGSLAAPDSYNDTASFYENIPNNSLDFITSTKITWGVTDSVYIQIETLDSYFIQGLDPILIWSSPP